MFDNPKKELERLEQQLLAAESYDEEDDYEDQDDLYDDTDEEFEADEPFDRELDALLNGDGSHLYDTSGRNIGRRAAGFDADDYEMDADRYVSAPKKKNTGLIIFALVQAMAIIGFVLWALRRML